MTSLPVVAAKDKHRNAMKATTGKIKRLAYPMPFR
jgi:hypothetical protein